MTEPVLPMPKEESEWSIYDKLQSLIEEADNIIISQQNQLLLGACNDLEQIANLQNVPVKSIMNGKLFEWYESQKLVDMMERKKIRSAAISKLTLEERRVLGLK